jgi:hypothetical protein
LPPQSTLAAVAYEGVIFSLAHAESTSTVAASKLSAAEDRFGKCSQWFPPLVNPISIAGWWAVLV